MLNASELSGHGLAVRPADANEVPAVSVALARAFASEPVVNWLVPQRTRRTARRELMFTLEIEECILRRGGVALTADDGSGALVGGCLVLPPGRWQTPLSMDGRTALRWLWALGTKLPRASCFVRAVEGHHLVEPHYYVRWIGIKPELQGHGLGSALMAPALDRCDREGLPAYIEASTERSAALYGRLGFVPVASPQLSEDLPRIWPMRRPPR
jgi:GNAT superfamily N-acetyltransferase